MVTDATIVAWGDLFAGVWYCKGEHASRDEVIKRLGAAADVTSLLPLPLGAAMEMAGEGSPAICEVCGRDVSRWLGDA